LRKDKRFSVDFEPALGHGPITPDPSEERAAPVDDRAGPLERLRDSVANEPAMSGRYDPRLFGRWVKWKRRRCSLAGNLAVTLLVAAVSGPLAVVGALVTADPGFGRYLYVLVFGPVVEELAKQAGMIYLLERKPWRLFAAWQFVFSAVVAGFAFSAIENVLYVTVYAADAGPEAQARLAAFRWAVCTPMHIACATIASFGLIRAWWKSIHESRPADLSTAFPMVVLAMLVHGSYNLVAVFLDGLF
jgi:RsiW-degrading membrane proteinase PrsW (M82 family)